MAKVLMTVEYYLSDMTDGEDVYLYSQIKDLFDIEPSYTYIDTIPEAIRRIEYVIPNRIIARGMRTEVKRAFPQVEVRLRTEDVDKLKNEVVIDMDGAVRIIRGWMGYIQKYTIHISDIREDDIEDLVARLVGYIQSTNREAFIVTEQEE